MQKICRVFTQAKNEHGYTWKLYALIRRGKKKTRKRLKDSAKQPASSDPQDFGVKMNRGFSGFILFCVILLCPILWRRRAGNVVKDEPNESAWKKCSVFLYYIRLMDIIMICQRVYAESCSGFSFFELSTWKSEMHFVVIYVGMRWVIQETL